MTIKFLWLPWLVQKEILVNMGIIDLFTFGNISQRMNRIVKRDVKVRNHIICFYFGESILISFFTSKRSKEQARIVIEPLEKLPEEHPIKKPGDNFIPVFNKDASILRTFWVNQLDGAKFLFEAVNKVFEMPVAYVQIDLDDVKRGYRNVLRWINEWREPPVDMIIRGENCNSPVFTWIAEHATASNSISICSQKQTDGTLKKWLQRLRRGSNSKLKELNLEMYQHVDLQTVLNKLMDEEELTVEGNVWSFWLENGEKCSVRNIKFRGRNEIIDGVEIIIERN